MARLKIISTLTLFTLASPLALAQTDSENEVDVGQLAEQVAQAYGITRDSIRNYRVTERYISPAIGQSWSPDWTNIGRINQQFVHDLQSGNSYFENWFSGRGGLFPAATVVKDEQASTVNLRRNTYSEAPSADPYVIAGGTMRTTDTLLALELLKAADQAEYLGEANYLNRDHHQVQLPFPSSPALTLYIDKETGLINRMTRDNPQLGQLHYEYNDHEKNGGIVSATQVNFAIGGTPNLIGLRRDVEFNTDIDPTQFELPDTLSKAERFDDQEMVVNKISDKVYHIGQSGAYSIFIDTAEGLVGAGGSAGLAQRLAKFREESNNHRPLRYQVITHHHSDHLAGVVQTLDLGATLVTVAANREPLRGASQQPVSDERFLLVDGQMTLGNGSNEVELYKVSTIHARDYLLLYVPGERTLFMADHFGTPNREGAPVANRNTMSMHQALQPLELKFNKIVTAHGGRVFSAKDFKAAVDGFEAFDCPSDSELCPG